MTVRVFEGTRITLAGGKIELEVHEREDGHYDLEIKEHADKKVRLPIHSGSKMTGWIFWTNIVARYLEG